MKLTLLTPTGITGSTTVSDKLFGVDVKPTLLTQAARVYLANARQATSKVKTRSEINRTKKKWYRQKGTGGARHGARTANIFVGGGVAHGPDGSQNFDLNLTLRFKRQALALALTAQKDHCLVISEIVPLTNQTKMAAAFLKPAVKPGEKVLLVTKNHDAHIQKSVANLSYVTLRSAVMLNAYDVIRADKILFAPDSLTVIESKVTAVKKIKVARPQKPLAVTSSVAPEQAKKIPAQVAKSPTKVTATPAKKTQTLVTDKLIKKPANRAKSSSVKPSLKKKTTKKQTA